MLKSLPLPSFSKPRNPRLFGRKDYGFTEWSGSTHPGELIQGRNPFLPMCSLESCWSSWFCLSVLTPGMRALGEKMLLRGWCTWATNVMCLIRKARKKRAQPGEVCLCFLHLPTSDHRLRNEVFPRISEQWTHAHSIHTKWTACLFHFLVLKLHLLLL